ncbi:MAG: molybdate ABC transporter substrate-binding protein [Verrucomicrobia bacterium]|nr:molybdate ABC transporter substrate-binding protein [Verrucomicrobiota bacterium]
MAFRALLLALALSALSVAAPAAELRVSAAASLTDALQELEPVYEKATGDRLVFNFASSSVLARQIKEGAPADLFLSADEPQMDALAKAGLLLENTRRDLLGNTLVVVVPLDAKFVPASPAELRSPQIRRIALGEPSSVPAGVYAKAHLVRLGLWEALQSKCVSTENVRAALAAVASGNADAAWVYKTDAAAARKARIAFETPAAEGPKIVYPLAVVKSSAQPEAAHRLATFLASPPATAIFQRHGFLILPSARQP